MRGPIAVASTAIGPNRSLLDGPLLCAMCPTMRQSTSGNMALGMAIGVGLGAALGTAFDNLPIGVAVGIAIGAACGAFFGNGKSNG